MYPDDVLASRSTHSRKAVRQVPADLELVVETLDGYCGAVVALGRTIVAGEQRDTVILADRLERRREFPMLPASFLLEGELVTLVRPVRAATGPARPGRTASGSVAVAGVKAQVAKASRIWVEGAHDAALVERIWGDDLRIEGVVVQPLGGIDDLAEQVHQFQPGAGRRLGVLVDHLVPGSKETRIAASVTSPHVLIKGHPYVDIWQAVKPTALGIKAWPVIGRDVEWKDGIAAALGVSDTREMWRRVLASVNSFADVEVPLLRSVEELIDFVTG
ncbi:MAG TPA: DUF3097 domain-containing protein [Jatrophihabitans sp.]